MFHTYQPSGKISPVFYPMLILTMLIVAPSVSFLYVYFIWYIPSTLADIIAYAAALVILCAISGKYCIKIGKVRSKKAAGIAAAIIFLWFCYLSAVIFHSLFVGQNSFEGVRQAFTDPKALLHTMQTLIKEGYPIESLRKGFIFTYHGKVMPILWGIKFLCSLCYVRYYLRDDSVQPFSETVNQWYRAYVLLLEGIPDVEEFKKKIFFGDNMAIRGMKALTEANKDHCEATVYAVEGDINHYVTLVNKHRKGEPDKDGEVKFENEEIFEFLSISGDIGNLLLTQGQSQDTKASVKIVNSQMREKAKMQFLKTAALSAIQVGVMVFLMIDKERLTEAFSNMGVMSFLLLNVVVWGGNLWGAFRTEAFVEDYGGLQGYRGVRSYMVKEESSPIYYKIFYFVMFIISFGIFVYCVRGIM